MRRTFLFRMMKVRPAPAAILLFSPTSSHFRDMRHLLGRTSRRGRNTDGDQQQTSSSVGFGTMTHMGRRLSRSSCEYSMKGRM
ncbi:hypothetical protein NQZ68_031789 [Dissostichus eleginoides]|nr:hypothetical protein NQZ68_031789 [Dissostichus eleginoides]